MENTRRKPDPHRNAIDPVAGERYRDVIVFLGGLRSIRAGAGPGGLAVKGISTQSGNMAQRASSRLITALYALIITPESERSAAWSRVPRTLE